MQFVDLTDSDFKFECSFAGDGVDYWDYNLSASLFDEQHNRLLTVEEIKQLRDNCRSILKATDNVIKEQL